MQEAVKEIVIKALHNADLIRLLSVKGYTWDVFSRKILQTTLDEKVLAEGEVLRF